MGSNQGTLLNIIQETKDSFSIIFEDLGSTSLIEILAEIEPWIHMTCINNNLIQSRYVLY